MKIYSNILKYVICVTAFDILSILTLLFSAEFLPDNKPNKYKRKPEVIELVIKFAIFKSVGAF